MDKATLRREALKHRQRMHLSLEQAESAAQRFMEVVKPTDKTIVGAYWPTRNEFSAQLLLEKLQAAHIPLCLPVIEEGTRLMRYYTWREGDPMTANRYGILEPENRAPEQEAVPDILLVPLLAFDRNGTRLGYGGGYFDTTLEKLRAEKDVTAIGLAYAEQIVLFPLPREAHDQKMDMIITEQDVFEFSFS